MTHTPDPERAPAPSGLVDWNDPRRNLYGCSPCPKCGDNHRAGYRVPKPEVRCDDCGFCEPTTFAEGAAEARGGPNVTCICGPLPNHWHGTVTGLTMCHCGGCECVMFEAAEARGGSGTNG